MGNLSIGVKISNAEELVEASQEVAINDLTSSS